MEDLFEEDRQADSAVVSLENNAAVAGLFAAVNNAYRKEERCWAWYGIEDKKYGMC